MRLHRFYTPTSISDEKFDISDRELVSQWRSVFRYNVGSQVILFDGSGTDFLCMITSLRNLGATVEVVQKKQNKNMPKINLWLCIGIIKKDNFEWANGTDPSYPYKKFHITGREFENALVLVKWRPKDSFFWSTDTVHNLDTNFIYRILNVDGTLSSPVDNVRLRNNQAVILIKEKIPIAKPGIGKHVATQ